MYTGFVKNVTISLDEELIRQTREFAQKQGTTLNQLIRDLLTRTVEQDRKQKIVSFLQWTEKENIAPEGGTWLSREEIHER